MDFAWRAATIAERRRQLADTGLTLTQNEFKLGNLSQDKPEQRDRGPPSERIRQRLRPADFLSAWSDFVSLVGVDPAMNNLPSRYVHPVR